MGVSPEGYFSDHGVAIHQALAEGGVGLIISGHMIVMPPERNGGMCLGTCMYDDRFIHSIRQMATAVHHVGNGCKVMAQINHVGMQDIIDTPVSPSGVSWPNMKKALHVLSTHEVEAIVAHFVEAAQRVHEAGFDGVELHCAHGYLLSSFLSPYTNRRTDKYGGSPEKRVTIVREIVTQIRKQLGSDFPVLVKMNCDDIVEGGIGIDSFPALAHEVAKTGVDAIEVSGNNPLRKNLDQPEKQSYYSKYVERLNIDIPIILTGGNKSIVLLEKIFNQENVDFFGVARPLIREPNLPHRWLEGLGEKESSCISCNRCFQALVKGKMAQCSIQS
jgi:2,4-dienoyl-CoA reductase-like NADH-dependent reductase (Old Yellow Enzyme family)